MGTGVLAWLRSNTAQRAGNPRGRAPQRRRCPACGCLPAAAPPCPQGRPPSHVTTSPCRYAKSLDATRFHHQPAGGKAGGGKGGGGGKGHAGQKQAGGVKKADLLRQKAAAERAAKAGDSAEEQWKLVRKGLEDR